MQKKSWSEMSDRQKKTFTNKLEGVLSVFEKTNNVSVEEMLNTEDYLPKQIDNVLARVVAETCRNVRRSYENPNTEPITASKVYSESLALVRALPIPGQNEVIANLLSTIKSERLAHFEQIEEKRKTIESNYKKAGQALDALNAITSGGMDQLHFRD